MKLWLKRITLAAVALLLFAVMAYYTARGIDQDLRDHYAAQIASEIPGKPLPADILN